MVKCKFCNNTATRCHANHDSGLLEDLCEIHYFEHEPTQAKVNWYNVRSCIICDTRSDKCILHHVSYFPEEIVVVCRGCHKLIHSGKIQGYLPQVKDIKLFYEKVVK